MIKLLTVYRHTWAGVGRRGGIEHLTAYSKHCATLLRLEFSKNYCATN
jgi:hypothetical protein